jgi:hypothetical protein
MASPGCGAKVTLEIRRARGNSRALTTAERTSTGYYERGIRPKRPDVHAAVVLNDRSLDPIREFILSSIWYRPVAPRYFTPCDGYQSFPAPSATSSSERPQIKNKGQNARCHYACDDRSTMRQRGDTDIRLANEEATPRWSPKALLRAR